MLMLCLCILLNTYYLLLYNLKSVLFCFYFYFFSNCSRSEHSVFLLMAVPSRAGNFREKMAIRNSWGSVVKQDTSIRLIFFVGKEVDELDQK